MKFAIASLEYWNALGYDTTHWRKSVDGTLAMCHYNFAVLADENEIEVYDVASQEFKDLLASEVWSKQEYIDPDTMEMGLQTAE